MYGIRSDCAPSSSPKTAAIERYVSDHPLSERLSREIAVRAHDAHGRFTDS